MQEEKLKALANEMMETFQKQGLTCREAEKVLGLLRIRAGEQSSAAVDKTPFTAKPF